MYEKVLDKLSKSRFRSRFCLSRKDKDYINKKGLDVVESHVRDFVRLRISQRDIINDGKQTPYKGHPAFIAQHATATCCRTCISKWHNYPVGTELSESQQNHLVGLIMEWLKHQYEAV